MPADTAPPPGWARDAWFVLSTYGDGGGTSLHRGWAALSAAFLAAHYHDPDEDQIAEVTAYLTDWGQWEYDPYKHLWRCHWTYEDGNIAVERVTDTTALAAARREALAEAADLVSRSYRAEGTRDGKRVPVLMETFHDDDCPMAAAILALADRDPQPGTGGNR